MVAGHLREQNGIYQSILSWKDSDGKRRNKQISTGLPVKGNKKRAENMLLKVRTEFDPENAVSNAAMSFDKFLQKWLKDRATAMSPDSYAHHSYNVKNAIAPFYLTAHVPAVLEQHNMPRIRFHDLRHSCASLLFAQGVAMKDIQAWLGHSTIGTTANIYTHLDENSKINSANAILSILPK